MGRKHTELLVLLKAKAPWVVCPTKSPSLQAQYFFLAVDCIFQVEHLKDAKHWAASVVDAFIPNKRALLTEVVKATNLLPSKAQSFAEGMSIVSIFINIQN